ncbi:hypothetical protein GNI_095820 [Gregarina niphandrodes]|uniref:Uncharacterized protein n=1 Tax=Gregarina niphandrodes TaxID=110365 RepID=A0A023B518_GRENI|nr:hypothetical protein GNI_095820 [Gregarina niphandrodes]EZG58016.1 hypothetical protein GNI_095820 [Gregarina niphandrodes]|eukprot:XP_011130989.1 hypothetical protein GNI_095820 [Gregarina niphandrodes]
MDESPSLSQGAFAFPTTERLNPSCLRPLFAPTAGPVPQTERNASLYREHGRRVVAPRACSTDLANRSAGLAAPAPAPAAPAPAPEALAPASAALAPASAAPAPAPAAPAPAAPCPTLSLERLQEAHSGMIPLSFPRGTSRSRPTPLGIIAAVFKSWVLNGLPVKSAVIKSLAAKSLAIKSLAVKRLLPRIVCHRIFVCKELRRPRQ